ncbi:MAG: hypothetical protein R2942_19925 [Ignavibacteria bacterium]
MTELPGQMLLLAEEVLGGQGWYDNVLGVCPTNSNIVLAGGIRLFRSTNSGTT